MRASDSIGILITKLVTNDPHNPRAIPAVLPRHVSCRSAGPQHRANFSLMPRGAIERPARPSGDRMSLQPGQVVLPPACFSSFTASTPRRSPCPVESQERGLSHKGCHEGWPLPMRCSHEGWPLSVRYSHEGWPLPVRCSARGGCLCWPRHLPAARTLDRAVLACGKCGNRRSMGRGSMRRSLPRQVWQSKCGSRGGGGGGGSGGGGRSGGSGLGGDRHGRAGKDLHRRMPIFENEKPGVPYPREHLLTCWRRATSAAPSSRGICPFATGTHGPGRLALPCAHAHKRRLLGRTVEGPMTCCHRHHPRPRRGRCRFQLQVGIQHRLEFRWRCRCPCLLQCQCGRRDGRRWCVAFGGCHQQRMVGDRCSAHDWDCEGGTLRCSGSQ